MPCTRHAPPRERQRDATGADPELERRAAPPASSARKSTTGLDGRRVERVADDSSYRARRRCLAEVVLGTALIPTA